MNHTKIYSAILTVFMFGHSLNLSAQYDDNDNDTDIKVGKGKSDDDRDNAKRNEVIQKSLEKKKGILLGDTVYYLGKPYCLFIVEKKFLGSTLKWNLPRKQLKNIGTKKIEH